MQDQQQQQWVCLLSPFEYKQRHVLMGCFVRSDAQPHDWQGAAALVLQCSCWRVPTKPRKVHANGGWHALLCHVLTWNG
jgi:hypothetical protein